METATGIGGGKTSRHVARTATDVENDGPSWPVGEKLREEQRVPAVRGGKVGVGIGARLLVIEHQFWFRNAFHCFVVDDRDERMDL